MININNVFVQPGFLLSAVTAYMTVTSPSVMHTDRDGTWHVSITTVYVVCILTLLYTLYLDFLYQMKSGHIHLKPYCKFRTMQASCFDSIRIMCVPIDVGQSRPNI